MLDHLGINVSDYERSRDFYAAALAPLGHSLLMEPIPRFGGFAAPTASRRSGSPTSASR